MRVPVVSMGAVLIALASLSACNDSVGSGTGAQADGRAFVETYGEVEANGTQIEVRMYTSDPDEPGVEHVFKPALVKARVGDTITFIPVEPGHFSASIPGMLPDGVEGWEGELDQPVSFVVPQPGVYGYKCTPHYGAGMVGLIVVEGGENADTAKLQSHPGLASGVFARLFAEAGL